MAYQRRDQTVVVGEVAAYFEAERQVEASLQVERLVQVDLFDQCAVDDEQFGVDGERIDTHDVSDAVPLQHRQKTPDTAADVDHAVRFDQVDQQWHQHLGRRSRTQRPVELAIRSRQPFAQVHTTRRLVSTERALGGRIGQTEGRC